MGKKVEINSMINDGHALLGAKVAPFGAWYILKTPSKIPLRMKQYKSTTMKLAHWLQEQDGIRSVHYPE